MQQHTAAATATSMHDRYSSLPYAEAWQHQVPPLPFELQVLEVVLGDVVALASQLARDLEAVVHPALDSLMKSVSPALHTAGQDCQFDNFATVVATYLIVVV